MSDNLFELAAGEDKNFHLAEGANFMSLYDVPQHADDAVTVLAPFFKEHPVG